MNPPTQAHAIVAAIDVNGSPRGKVIPIRHMDGPHTLSTTLFFFGHRDTIAVTDYLAAEPVARKLRYVVRDQGREVPWGDGKKTWFYLELDSADTSYCDGRALVRKIVDGLNAVGIDPHIGLEIEFLLLPELGDSFPLSASRSYDAAPHMTIQRFMDSCLRFCEEAGIAVDSIHTEQGRGMIELVLEHGSPLKIADDAAMLRVFLPRIAGDLGLKALFQPFAVVEGMGIGFGCHHNLSFWRRDHNLLVGNQLAFSTFGMALVRRLAENAAETCAVFRPWPESYARNNRKLWSPDRASAGADDHLVSVRYLLQQGQDRARIEHRISGVDANWHYTTACLLQTALDCGIADLPSEDAAVEGTPTYDFGPLPPTLQVSAEHFATSETAHRLFGQAFRAHLVRLFNARL